MKRSWKLEVERVIRQVRAGTMTAADAVDDLELALLMAADPEHGGRFIELGDLTLGTRRSTFGWLAQLANYEHVRFTGLSWRRLFVGAVLGSTEGARETARKERIELILSRSKES